MYVYIYIYIHICIYCLRRAARLSAALRRRAQIRDRRMAPDWGAKRELAERIPRLHFPVNSRRFPDMFGEFFKNKQHFL